MAEKKNDADSTKTFCPLGKFFQGLEGLSKNAPEVWEHLNRSRLEFLKAIKTVLDSKIDALEKKSKPGKRKVAKRITIE
ncbi:MAG: hypothetical protein LJE96_16725 [Deltaproteobacteria bacterium]|nr:hypothetical protein [Deltaproteobacteria bacterium]